MKNPTSGDYSIMMNSIHTAQHSHTFIYRGWEATSQGNPLAHAILRGYTNSKGEHYPNYHYEDIIRLCEAYEARPHLKNPAAIIDANHENSGKDPLQQPRIIKEVLDNRRYNTPSCLVFSFSPHRNFTFSFQSNNPLDWALVQKSQRTGEQRGNKNEPCL